MYKLSVITDNRTADGFRLAGIEVVAAETVEIAQEAILELLSDKEAGIIALDSRLAEAIDERIDRKLALVYRPLLVILPLGDELNTEAMAKLRLSRLIKKAVGFDVTLKRG